MLAKPHVAVENPRVPQEPVPLPTVFRENYECVAVHSGGVVIGQQPPWPLPWHHRLPVGSYFMDTYDIRVRLLAYNKALWRHKMDGEAKPEPDAHVAAYLSWEEAVREWDKLGFWRRLFRDKPRLTLPAPPA